MDHHRYIKMGPLKDVWLWKLKEASDDLGGEDEGRGICDKATLIRPGSSRAKEAWNRPKASSSKVARSSRVTAVGDGAEGTPSQMNQRG